MFPYLLQVNVVEDNHAEFDHEKSNKNEQDSDKTIDEPMVETDANGAYNDELEEEELEEEDDSHELEMTTEPDMDLSLLNDDDGIEDSDVDKSNDDDAETLKLLNEDDEAFESFLEEGENSNEDLIHRPSISTSGQGNNTNQEREFEQVDHSLGLEAENSNVYRNQEDEECLLENTDEKIESEEEEIDDEMEGDD